MFVGTNHPKGNRGQFPGEYCQGAIIFGVIFGGGAIIEGENFLGGNCPDTHLKVH